MNISEFSKPEVLEFYRTLPFNTHGDVQQNVTSIRSHNSVENYPCLVPLLSASTSVLEIGCGAGWLSNSIAHYYHANVTGIDFNTRVIEYAQEASQQLGLNNHFHTSDLFLYSPEAPFDVAVSLGVLHHTGNCRAAIEKICTDFVKPGGYFFLGLYHHYGRRPFLKHFGDLRAAHSSEDTLFAEYARLHSNLVDETHLRSWFRDQVLHPHETQHTLGEINAVMESVDMQIVSTSLNKFDRIDDMAQLIEQEEKQEEISQAKLESGIYFPGFFVVLARRAIDD